MPAPTGPDAQCPGGLSKRAADGPPTGREADAVAAYQAALRLSLPAAERGYLQDCAGELIPGARFRG